MIGPEQDLCAFLRNMRSKGRTDLVSVASYARRMAPRAPLHLVEPGTVVDVAALDAADTSAAPGDKGITRGASEALADRLAGLQEILWARRDHSVLVVLQGIDTSGKGGTVEHVFGAVNPAGLRVVSFKAPTRTELERDYLWRIHAQVPADGEIGVFDRSHYEDVLAVRVEGLAPEEVWRAASTTSTPSSSCWSTRGRPW